MNKGTALVIGGGGFIGSHLVELLLEKGHQVIVLQRNVDPFLSNVRVKCIFCDINDILSIKRNLRGIDWVFHLAHTTLPQNSNLDPVYDVQSNVISSLALLQACVESKVKRVLYASSGGTVYGLPRGDFIDESHPTNPLCSYGITKLMIEKYFELFRLQHGLDYRILRIANPYGERQRVDKGQGAVAVFLHKMLRGEPIEIWGDGSVVRDYIYVRDVARAFYLAMRTEDDSERIFNIGSGFGISLREMVDKMHAYTGGKVKIFWGEKRAIDVPRNVLSTERAQRILGWTPLTSFDEGLDITGRYMKMNLIAPYSSQSDSVVL